MKSVKNSLVIKEQLIAMSMIIASTLFVGILLVVLIKVFNLQNHVNSFLIWVDSAGIWGPVIFIIVDMLVVILLLPGVLVTMGAGFIFGVTMGSIYVVTATTLGALVSFTVSRYLFGIRVKRFFESHEKAAYMNQYLASDGWKIIFFTRMIPFFPFKLSNYLFGLTDFKMSSFAVGTFLGIWPITIFNVYIGSLAADISNLGALSEMDQSRFYFYLFSFLIAVIAIIYITSKAKSAMAQYISSQNNQ